MIGTQRIAAQTGLVRTNRTRTDRSNPLEPCVRVEGFETNSVPYLCWDNFSEGRSGKACS